MWYFYEVYIKKKDSFREVRVGSVLSKLRMLHICCSAGKTVKRPLEP